MALIGSLEDNRTALRAANEQFQETIRKQNAGQATEAEVQAAKARVDDLLQQGRQIQAEIKLGQAMIESVRKEIALVQARIAAIEKEISLGATAHESELLQLRRELIGLELRLKQLQLRVSR
jgi:peptidoglycan hydrolase CwlO-like protein